MVFFNDGPTMAVRGWGVGSLPFADPPGGVMSEGNHQRVECLEFFRLQHSPAHPLLLPRHIVPTGVSRVPCRLAFRSGRPSNRFQTKEEKGFIFPLPSPHECHGLLRPPRDRIARADDPLSDRLSWGGVVFGDHQVCTKAKESQSKHAFQQQLCCALMQLSSS